jgi:hypothetical protein
MAIRNTAKATNRWLPNSARTRHAGGSARRKRVVVNISGDIRASLKLLAFV